MSRRQWLERRGVEHGLAIVLATVRAVREPIRKPGARLWPGNTTDVTTLDRVAGRLQSRFGVRRVCLVAGAGMMSKKRVAAVEARGWLYILGARLRRITEASRSR